MNISGLFVIFDKRKQYNSVIINNSSEITKNVISPLKKRKYYVIINYHNIRFDVVTM